MQFIETPLAGAFVVEVDYFADARGGFARTFCADEFAEHGLPGEFVQCATSYNAAAGTLRGMHFQDPPHSQAKLVRVTAGSIYDAIVDLRPGSATYGRSFAVELSAATRRMLYIPKRFAHGFLTLEPGSEVFYQFDERYAPGAEGGIHYADPDLAIAWPRAVEVVAERDANLQPLSGLAER